MSFLRGDVDNALKEQARDLERQIALLGEVWSWKRAEGQDSAAEVPRAWRRDVGRPRGHPAVAQSACERGAFGRGFFDWSRSAQSRRRGGGEEKGNEKESSEGGSEATSGERG
jgi:hypothetical protein